MARGSPRTESNTPTGRPAFQLAAACLLGGVLTGCSQPEGPDIVLVVLDTVRQDFTGAAADRSFTPALDRLAADGTIFTHAFANGVWTVPSHASIFTGLGVPGHGSTTHQPRFTSGSPTTAELLAAAGYDTAAFFSNPWLSDEATGVARGFERRYVAEIRGDGFPGDQGGSETLGHFAAWLDGRSERPFFAFVNFLEAHLPYDPHPDLRQGDPLIESPGAVVSVEWSHEFNAGLIPPETVHWQRLRALYGADVRTADRYLAKLVELLRTAGRYDDTVIVVTSDHGEQLGEHGLVEHQFSIWETLLAVPLVVRAPGFLPAGERSDPAMLSDLFATMLELAGIRGVEPPPTSRSLLAPAARSRPLLAHYAGGPRALIDDFRSRNPELDPTPLELAYSSVRVGKLRLTIPNRGSPLLHDLDADPGQVNDLAGDHPEIVEELLELGRVGEPTPFSSESPSELSPEMRRRLETLGYL